MSKLGSIRINFTKLEGAHPALCAIIRKETHFYKYGFYLVDLDLLTNTAVALDVKNFVERQQDSMPDLPPPPQPPAPEPQIDFAELERDQRAQMDERAARAQLDQWVSEGNLEPCDFNLSLIRHYITTQAGDYFSADSVNAAVEALGPQGSNRLRWLALAPPQPAPPAPPVIVLTKLKDGTTQLPLDADERTMKRAGVAQLYDLNARRREASKQQFRDNSARYVGSFGSKSDHRNRPASPQLRAARCLARLSPFSDSSRPRMARSILYKLAIDSYEVRAASILPRQKPFAANSSFGGREPLVRRYSLLDFCGGDRRGSCASCWTCFWPGVLGERLAGDVHGAYAPHAGGLGGSPARAGPPGAHLPARPG